MKHIHELVSSISYDPIDFSCFVNLFLVLIRIGFFNLFFIRNFVRFSGPIERFLT